MKEKLAALEARISELQIEHTTTEADLSRALENQEAEHFPDFADPVVIPKGWKMTGPVDLKKHSEGRPADFIEMVASARNRRLRMETMMDLYRMAQGKYDEVSDLDLKTKLGDLRNQYYKGWTTEDFIALQKGIKEEHPVEKTNSFDQLAEIVQKKMRNTSTEWTEYYPSDVAASEIRMTLKDLLQAQRRTHLAPEFVYDGEAKEFDFKDIDSDQIMEAMTTAVTNDTTKYQIALMGEVLFRYADGERGGRRHFDDAALARGLDAFIHRYLPFLKREPAKES